MLRLFISASFLLMTPSLLMANDELKNALQNELRSEQDKARDVSRKPYETLNFFSVKPDSKVLELIPGGGWYTRILASYLKDHGQLFLALGVKPELNSGAFAHTEIVGKTFEFEQTELHPGIRTIANDKGTLEVKGLDVALTFRNMHNMDEAARRAVNKAVFKALKPGGVYGVIDHTKRHMEAYDDETWRRADPVQIIKELVSIGFEFVDYSDIHARAHDELIYDTTDDSVNRDSDRFTLKFRKPM